MLRIMYIIQYINTIVTIDLPAKICHSYLQVSSLGSQKEIFVVFLGH